MASVQSLPAKKSSGVRQWLRQPSAPAWIVFFGLGLRLILLFALRHNEVFQDEVEYRTIGLNLLQTGSFTFAGHATAYRAPGEPFFIAGVFRLFGAHTLLVKVIQELLLSLLPVYCARLARLIGLGPAGANLTALVVAFHPALAYAVTTLYPTALAALLLAIGVTYGARAASEDSLSDAMKGGLGLGAAGMFVTTFAPLSALAGAYLMWKRRFRAGLVLGLIGTVPLVAWVARNRVAMGAWVVATNDGVNLFLGANERATPRSGNWVPLPALKFEEDELASSRELGADAKWWIREHPARWAELCVARAVLVLDSVGKPVSQGAHTGLGAKLIGWLLLPFVLLGIAGLWVYRSTAASWMAGLALMLVVVSSATTIVKPRFRFPVDPLLAPFAVGLVAARLRDTNLAKRV